MYKFTALYVVMLLAGCAHATHLPFDPHRDQVAVQTILKGEQLTFLVDTAVTPGGIDLATAKRLDLLARDEAVGEAAGVGSGSASVYHAVIEGAAIGSLSVERMDMAAFDMTLLAQRYGRPLHGIWGDAFLTRRRVLIDYPAQRISFLPDGSGERRLRARCRMLHTEPLVFMAGSRTPRLMLTISGKPLPVSLDTGSSESLELFQQAVDDLGLAAAMTAKSGGVVTGSRGDADTVNATLITPVTYGPFTFNDVRVSLSKRKGSTETRLGNLGNRLLREFVLLIDYPSRTLTLAGGCRTKH